MSEVLARLLDYVEYEISNAKMQTEAATTPLNKEHYQARRFAFTDMRAVLKGEQERAIEEPTR